MHPSQTLPIHPTRRHPLTGAPIQAIWVSPRGRVCWPIMGGDGTTTGDGTDGDQGAGDGGQDAGQQSGGTGAQDQGQQAQDGQQQGQQQAAAEKVEDLPDWAQKLIRDTRQEAGDNRTAKNAAEQERQKLLDGIATALGIKPDGDQGPKPEEITQQLTAAQTQARQAAVELAVFKAAGKHQGDADALLDSRSFLSAVKDLDPAADDFAAKVDAAIKTAVEANPKLKAGRAPGASSVDHGAGGPGNDGAPRTPKPLSDAVSGHYGG